MGVKDEGVMKGTSPSKTAGSRQLCVSVLKALEQAAICSNSLLEGDDRELIEATCPDTRKSGHDASRRILAAITAIGSRYAVIASSSETDSDHSGSETSLTPADIVFDHVMETTGEALEHFNSSLDSVRGIKDAVVAETGAIGPETRVASLGASNPKRQCAFLEMEKPQIHFPDYPVDNSDTPFVPPNGDAAATTDLDVEPQEEKGAGVEVGLYLQNLFKANSKPTVGGAAGRKHPYEEEINASAIEMSQRDFKEEDTSVYGSLEKTPCTYVVADEDLFNMAERLKQVTEIAVDIENHSVRSFQGFTCLIQISTRREDFVVDALALRGSIHRALAPVFADGDIVKVLHGADRDVQWLERDFGIYVVNMFDTGQAARLLKFPSAALSYLQARFCDITGTSKKKFQLSDWRQRPLPDDMYQYARSDTHYLLYIFDRLRTEIAKKDLTSKVWLRSAAISKKRHMKIRFEAGMPRHLCAKYGLGFDQHQIRLLEELYRWRDRRAREEDESLNYVAPLGILFGVVRARDKARTVQGLMAHGFGSKIPPPLIKANADEIVRLISDSLDAKLEDVSKENSGTPILANSAKPKGIAGDDDIEFSSGRLSTESNIQNGSISKSGAIKGSAEPPRTVHIASVKSSLRSKSTLFALDSDSDSDEPDQLQCVGKETITRNVAMETDRFENSPEKSTRLCRVPEDGPADRIISNTPTNANGENVIRPPVIEEPNVTPKVQAAAKSVFDLSDSESDSEQKEQNDPSRVDQGDNESVGRNNGDGVDGAATKATAVLTSYGTGNVSPSMTLCLSNVVPKVTATQKSIFSGMDVEEDSDDEGHQGAVSSSGKQLASTELLLAQVRAGMTGLAPPGPADFRVETDVVQEEDESSGEVAEGVEPLLKAKKRKREEEEDKREPMSLQEKYGTTSSKQKKKKKNRKRKERSSVNEGPAEVELPAYDYAKALREEKKRRETNEEKPFDPMQRLRMDWKEKGKGKKRPRKAKKTPGSGVRSMSFRAR